MAFRFSSSDKLAGLLAAAVALRERLSFSSHQQFPLFRRVLFAYRLPDRGFVVYAEVRRLANGLRGYLLVDNSLAKLDQDFRANACGHRPYRRGNAHFLFAHSRAR